MLANATRGSLATEFGLTVPKGMHKLDELIALVDADRIIPEQGREAITGLHNRCRELAEGTEASNLLFCVVSRLNTQWA
jgi:hypothetical protein